MPDLLKSIIQDLINNNPEQAQVSIHEYIVGKTQQITGLTEAAKPATIITGRLDISFIDDEDKDVAERFVRDWTFDSTWHRGGGNDPSGFEAAFKCWPFKGTRRVYRGLTFKTKSDYEFFMGAIKGGELNEPHMSSWAKSKDQAMTYAMLDDEYDEERFAKIVLSTLPTGKIVDAGKSSRGEGSEIIAAPGKFMVKIEAHEVAGGAQ